MAAFSAQAVELRVRMIRASGKAAVFPLPTRCGWGKRESQIRVVPETKVLLGLKMK
jgi:hypothetical protein